MMLDYAEIILRLTTATCAGAAIGLNRDLHDKRMGLRTLGLVSLGSAMAVMSMAEISPDAASRVVQGILTGIGFIGAGVIVHGPKPFRVHGLTTAACTWVTAALGILCGFGEWPVIAIAVPLIFILLIFGGSVERWFHSFRPRDASHPPDDRSGPGMELR